MKGFMIALTLLCLTATACASHTSRQLLQQLPISAIIAPCAKLGPPASEDFFNASRTCLQFWPTGARIRVPADTATTKWGQLAFDFANAFAQFQDRNGKQYPIADLAKPPSAQDFAAAMRWPLVLIKATLNTKGTVTAFTPELYVPYTTLMSTMVNTQFEGQLINTDPIPKGPNATSWFRWTFGSTISVIDGPTAKYGTFLYGTFDNLFRAVKDAKGVCRPALCADKTYKSPACKYYTGFFGKGNNTVTLNWDSSMHGPTDSELVPKIGATGMQYMSAFIKGVTDLLKPYTFVPRKYNFVAHGTPLGLPNNFIGTLTKTKTRIQYC